MNEQVKNVQTEEAESCLEIKIDGWLQDDTLYFGSEPSWCGRSSIEKRAGLSVCIGKQGPGVMHPDDIIRLYDHLTPFVERIKKHGHCEAQ